MIAMVAPIGHPLLYMAAIVVVAIGMVVWITYWLPRGFRATTRPHAAIPCILGILAVVAMVAFPPFRKVGVWYEVETGQSIDLTEQRRYDRAFFGDLPYYKWIGRCFAPKDDEGTGAISFAPNTPYYSTDVTGWTIKWWLLLAQLLVLFLIVLPFVRRKPILTSVERR